MLVRQRETLQLFSPLIERDCKRTRLTDLSDLVSSPLIPRSFAIVCNFGGIFAMRQRLAVMESIWQSISLVQISLS